MMRTCSNCGGFLQPEWGRCKICGSDRGAAPPPAPSTPAASSRFEGMSDMAWTVATVGSVALMVLVLAGVSSSQDLSPGYVLGAMLVPWGIVGLVLGLMKRRMLLGFALGSSLGCIGWFLMWLVPLREPDGG